MEGEGPKRLQLSATGPGEITAGQIATSGDIEVMNPDLVICHLDEGATLNMELTAETGKGYVPAAANRPADAPIGLIPVDALYCPVRQVSYKVENTRVGQELDYDKLTLTVETDGTVTPDDALAYAARILQDQLQLFVHFDEGMVQVPTMAGMAAPSPPRPRPTPTSSTATCSRRWTSWSCRCAAPTASRTTTSSISATWCRRPRRRCSALRISAARA